MSIATVKIELSHRTGSDLLPHTFGIDLLVALIRELAIVGDQKMAADDLADFGISFRTYIRRLVGLLPEERMNYYERNISKLIPVLSAELYDCFRDELVSRLIQYKIRKECLTVSLDEILRPES